jgi:hypothetical protein
MKKIIFVAVLMCCSPAMAAQSQTAKLKGEISKLKDEIQRLTSELESAKADNKKLMSALGEKGIDAGLALNPPQAITMENFAKLRFGSTKMADYPPGSKLPWEVTDIYSAECMFGKGEVVIQDAESKMLRWNDNDGGSMTVSFEKSQFIKKGSDNEILWFAVSARQNGLK